MCGGVNSGTVAAVEIKIFLDALNQPWLRISKVSSCQRSPLAEELLALLCVVVQLKRGEREQNVEVTVYFCQWVTPKALRALWPVNITHAPGMFQNLSLDTRTVCYSVGAESLPCFLFPVPRTGMLLWGDAWQSSLKV